jgi:hypothetical protein
MFTEEEFKTCSKCNKLKPINEYRFRQRSEDASVPRKPYSQCKQCEQEQSYVLSELKKEAPQKPIYCECCKFETKDLRLDHCHKTWSIRGWICQNCNVGISRLGDDIEGLQKAMEYLIKKNNLG